MGQIKVYCLCVCGGVCVYVHGCSQNANERRVPSVEEGAVEDL